MVAIIVTALITKPSSSIQVLSSSMVEGIKDVAGVIGLMIGIGIAGYLIKDAFVFPRSGNATAHGVAYLFRKFRSI